MLYRVVNPAELRLAERGIYDDGQHTDSPGYKHVWLRVEHALSWKNSRFYSEAERRTLAVIEIPVDRDAATMSHMDTFNCEIVYKVPLPMLKGNARVVG